MPRLRLLIALVPVLLQAQVAGRLSGVVVDPTGASIPDATVNVYVAGGKEPVLTGRTNESGVFAFVTVRPDLYDVSVEAKGFTKTVVHEVKVSPVQETALPAVKLEIQSAAVSVEVTGDAQTVQLSNSEI